MALTLHHDFTQAPVATAVLTALKGANLDVTRASVAKFEDWESNLRTVQANEPRITGARRVENLCRQSNGFDTTWSTSNVTVAQDATDPDGGSTAWTLTDDATTDEHWIGIGVTVDTSRLRNLSVYVKGGTARYVGLSAKEPATSPQYYVGIFDTNTGTWTHEGSYSACSNYAATDEGDGWWRISYTDQNDSAAYDSMYIAVSSGPDTTDLSYSGSGDTILIYGAQTELVDGQADPSPSEYVATTTAAAYSWYDTYKPAPSSVTNICLESQGFDDAAWQGGSNTTITAAAGVAPDGTTTAFDIKHDDSNEFKNQPITIEADTSYTFSAYVKQGLTGTHDWVKLQFTDVASPFSGVEAFFDISTGTEGTSQAIDAGTLLNATIEDDGDGWYRISVTGKLASGITAGNVSIRNSIADDNSTEEATDSVLWWGAQLEKAHHGANSVPSTYIPTTTQAESSYRTNLCLQSEDFSTTWTGGFEVIETDVTESPDGATTADRLESNTDGGTGNVWIGQSVTVSTSTDYTVSFYAKADTKTWCAFYSSAFTTPANGGTFFNLSAGSVGTTAAGHTASIESVGNSWYRCIVTFTTDASDTTGQIRIYMANGDNDYPVDLDGTSSIFVWGAQLEATAAPVPSTYIATTTAAQSANFASNSKDGASLDTAPTGLLVEEERTNVCLQSNSFDTTWTNTNSTETGEYAVAPDGTQTAWRLIDDSGGGGDVAVNIKQGFTITATDYTFSIYAKSDQLDWIALRQFGFDDGDVSAFFDLSSGSIGTVETGNTAGIESHGNGWYRVWITINTTTDLVGDIRVHVCEGDNDLTSQDDGTSSILVYGAQLEAGSFPTSYIATEGTSKTRNGENVKTTDTSWQSTGGGTFYIDFTPINSMNGTYLLADTTGSRIFYFSSNQLRSYDGTNVLVINSPTLETQYKTAMGYSDADLTMGAYINGVASTEASETYTAAAFDISSLSVGHLSGGSQHVCHIAEIRYYDTRLANSILENMSNGIFGILENAKYPLDAIPLDNTRFHNFIDSTGITKVGDLQGDYRNALAAMTNVTGASINDYSIDDLFLKYYESL